LYRSLQSANGGATAKLMSCGDTLKCSVFNVFSNA
jgi:hypothetical protein